MKNLAVVLAIMLAVMLTQTGAWGWEDRYKRVDFRTDPVADEMKYQENVRQYERDKAEYDSQFDGDELGKFMSDHYHRGPKAPKR